MVGLAETIEAFNIVVDSGGDIVQLVRHFHSVDDIVYRKSDFAQAPAAGKSLKDYQYKVLQLQEITFYDSPTLKYMSQVTGFPATSSAAPYSPDTDQLNDITTPFYYRLQRIIDGQIADKVLETDCYTQELISTYIKANLDIWWDL